MEKLTIPLDSIQGTIYHRPIFIYELQFIILCENFFTFSGIFAKQIKMESY